MNRPRERAREPGLVRRATRVMRAGRTGARKVEAGPIGVKVLRPERVPEATRIHNRQRRPVRNLQEVPVTRHEDTSLPGYRFLQNRDIVRITDVNPQRNGFVNHDSFLAEESLGRSNRAMRHAEFIPEHNTQLTEYRLANHERVLRNDDSEHIRADPPGREGTDKDIRVEEDPQEISRKMSSSVR